VSISILHKNTTKIWWQHWRTRLILLYLVAAILLLAMSIAGHVRLIQDIGKPFGGFFWAIDSNKGNQVTVVSTPYQLAPFAVKAQSLTSDMHIVAINGKPILPNISSVYQQAHAGENITYTITQNDTSPITVTRPITIFTADMWWQSYGLTFLAGLSWLVVGAFLVFNAAEWSNAVEGITLLPPAILLLLSSQWGNAQQSYYPGPSIQLLWVPAFALLGAAFIHLSLTYHPIAFGKSAKPSMMIDLLPYLPLIALLAYEWGSYLLLGYVPMRINISISLVYAAIGGMISFCIGLNTLLQYGFLLPGLFRQHTNRAAIIPSRVRHRIGDLLTLWIGGVGLGFCLGILPILLTGQPLVSLPTFYILVGVYPLILLYAMRSLHLMDRLQLTLEQREEALQEQNRTAQKLLQTNQELEHATSLLLHADAHLRSLLSQRIHDQPKQQALRIRSLLAHWQHKLRIEAERDSAGKVTVQPLLEALGKIRKISEELEGDLRGLQLLVEDVYQRRSLGLKRHLEKLVLEDLPMLHPESPVKVQADLWALDALSSGLEQTEEGAKIAEAIAYTVTQALLNIYNHAGATFAQIRTRQTQDMLEIDILDDGRGFDPASIPSDKTSIFKAQLKAREAGGSLRITSLPRPQPRHGTLVQLRIPLAYIESTLAENTPPIEPNLQTPQKSTQAQH
jgi:anti-sigma regulatory factor (Ser/Thr protein kinase)